MADERVAGLERQRQGPAGIVGEAVQSGPSSGRAGPRPCRTDGAARRAPERLVPARWPVAPQVTEEIHHGDRAEQPCGRERQAAQSPDLLLELVGAARVERPVPGVVWPRGDLVHEETATVGHEQLDAEHPDVVERRRERERPTGAPPGAERVGDGGRHHRRVQDSVAVPVLAHGKRNHGAVGPARQHHRELLLQGRGAPRARTALGPAARTRRARRRGARPSPDPCRRIRGGWS